MRTMKNTIIIISILMIFTIIFPKDSSAATTTDYNPEKNGFIAFNNAPRKAFIVSSNKLEDVKIRIKDNNQIDLIQLYKIDSKGKKKEVDLSAPKGEPEDQQRHEQVYAISHEKVLKGKTQSFYLKIKDKTGNIQYSKFRIRVKTKTVKGKKISRYSIDDSPRVIHWKVSNNKVTFEVKDNAGTKYVKIFDLNDNNKEVKKFENLKAGATSVTIDITKFKEVNGIYKLKIIAADIGKTPQTATRTVYFKIPEITKKEPVTDPTETTNTNKTPSTSTKNVSTFLANLEKISQQIQKDYKAGRPWKYTNGRNSINKLPMKKTFKGALASNVRTTNCSCCVLWALHECGILSADQKFYGNSKSKIHYTKGKNVKATVKKYATITKVGNKTAGQLIKEGKLKRGDICTYKSHTNAYIGNHKWYDGGRRFGSQGEGTYSNYTFKTIGPTKGTEHKKVTYIIRLKDQT